MAGRDVTTEAKEQYLLPGFPFAVYLARHSVFATAVAAVTEIAGFSDLAHPTGLGCHRLGDPNVRT